MVPLEKLFMSSKLKKFRLGSKSHKQDWFRNANNKKNERRSPNFKKTES